MSQTSQISEELFDAIARRAAHCQHLSDRLWDFAELGFTETRSAALLVETLKAEGFEVEMGVGGMPTAFVATWRGSIGAGNAPVIGFLAEYDALPMLSQRAGEVTPSPLVPGAPGHGCGHNSMAPMQVLAVCALKEVLERRGIAATLRLFGTPAEELLACKGFMARDGLFDGLDAVIDCHANTELGTAYGIQNNALFSFLVEFRGLTAHAGSRPWEGRSAADAVELMHAGTERLREHMMLDQRIHWVTLNGVSAPNVVPDMCSTWYYVRSKDPYIQDLYQRIRDCAKGAALMTGTTEHITFLAACHQRYSNKALAEALHTSMSVVGIPAYTEEEQQFARAMQQALGAPIDGLNYEVKIEDAAAVAFRGDSSDVGDVTLKAPTATLQFPAWVPHARAHTWSVTACMRGSVVHKGIVAGAKVAGLTTLDLLTKPGLLDAVKAEFAAMTAEHPYISYLNGAEPPIHWHAEDMASYRPQLEALEPKE